MKNKFLLTATLVAALTLATPLVANAAEAEGGSWKSNATGWWYEYANGSYVTSDFLTDKDGKTYYFDANGYMTTGWQYAEKKVEGGTLDPAWYYFDIHGAMVTGWQAIDGKWYYFNEDKESPYHGAMAQNEVAILEENGKETKQVFAPSGQWVSGWTYDYYRNPLNGVVESDGWYYANIGGTPYDYDTDESNPEYGGWLAYNGAWYYIGSNGAMATSNSYTDSKSKDQTKEYYVGQDGTMKYGWYQTGNGVDDWMYLNADGTVYGQANPETGKYDNSWLAYNGAWYYIKDGVMQTYTWIQSAVKGSDTKYYVGADGRMVTGWYNTSSQSATGSSTGWIYCKADGSDYTGWVASGGKWYYIQAGTMKANGACKDFNQKYPNMEDYKKADGTYDWDALEKAQNAYAKAYNVAPTYIFDGTGAMVTGWYNVKSTKVYDPDTGRTVNVDKWYYADADGKGHNGWLAYKGAWYYINNGEMLTNTYTPDGYWVGMDGVWR